MGEFRIRQANVISSYKHVVGLYHLKTAKKINAESDYNYAPVSYGAVAYAC